MDLDQVVDTIESAWSSTGAEIVRVLLLLLQAAAIVVIAVFAGRWAKRHLARSLGRTAIDRNIAVLTGNLAVAGIYLFATSAVLATFGASWAGVLTVVGAGTIVIGLSLQDLLKSYVAGVYLLLERPFSVGDRIQVRDVDGVVEGVELRTTILRSAKGEQVTIPNATVFLEIVTNRSTNRDDRTTVTLSKLDMPLADIPEAIRSTLAGLAPPASRPLKVDLLSSMAEGATVSVTLFHPPDADLAAAMLARLRETFPAAELAVERG